MKVVVQLAFSDTATRDSLLADSYLKAEQLESRGIDGFSDVISVVVYLVPVTIPILAKVIVEHIRSKKHIQIIHKGTTITGFDKEDAMEILQKLHHEENGDDSVNNS